MPFWKIAWRNIEQRALASSLTALSMALGVAVMICGDRDPQRRRAAVLAGRPGLPPDRRRQRGRAAAGAEHGLPPRPAALPDSVQLLPEVHRRRRVRRSHRGRRSRVPGRQLRRAERRSCSASSARRPTCSTRSTTATTADGTPKIYEFQPGGRNLKTHAADGEEFERPLSRRWSARSSPRSRGSRSATRSIPPTASAPKDTSTTPSTSSASSSRPAPPTTGPCSSTSKASTCSKGTPSRGHEEHEAAGHAERSRARARPRPSRAP